MKAGEEVCLTAVTQNVMVSIAAKSMNADIEVCLCCSHRDWNGSSMGAEFMNADKEVCLAAVTKNGNGFRLWQNP